MKRAGAVDLPLAPVSLLWEWETVVQQSCAPALCPAAWSPSGENSVQTLSLIHKIYAFVSGARFTRPGDLVRSALFMSFFFSFFHDYTASLLKLFIMFSQKKRSIIKRNVVCAPKNVKSHCFTFSRAARQMLVLHFSHWRLWHIY